jgi:hypothetical protein
MSELKVSNQHERKFIDAMFSLAPLQEKRLDNLEQFSDFMAIFNHRGLELWDNFYKEIEDNCMLLPKADKISYLKRLFAKLHDLIKDEVEAVKNGVKADSGDDGNVTAMPYKNGDRYGSYALPDKWLQLYYKRCSSRVAWAVNAVAYFLKTEGVTKEELEEFVGIKKPLTSRPEAGTSPQQFTTPYDFNDLTSIMVPLKAKQFEQIEDKLLQFGYLNCQREWKSQKNEMAAFIYALDAHQFLRRSSNQTERIRLNKAKKKFIGRYHCDCSNQFRPKVIKGSLKSLMEGLEIIFTLTSGE